MEASEEIRKHTSGGAYQWEQEDKAARDIKFAKSEDAANEARDESFWWATQNIGAEQAVLGSAMLEPKAAGQVMARCRAELFKREGHREVWYAMQAVKQAGLPIDLITVYQEVQKNGESVISPEYLMLILSQVPTVAHVNAYIHILEECRKLHLTATRGFARMHDPDAVTAMDDELRQIESGLTGAGASRVMGEFENLEAGIEAHLRQSGPFDHRVPHLDVAPLDQHSGGLPCPGLVVIMGESSSGKTTLALQGLYHWGFGHEEPCLYCSLEMDIEMQVVRRMAYIHAGTRAMGEEAFRLAVTEVAGNPHVHYYDRAGMTIADVEAEAKRVSGEVKLRFVAVDYLQLLGSDQGLDERQRLENASQRLKHLSKEIGATVVVISQVTWDKDKTDARTFGARGIGFDADMEIEVLRTGDTAFDQRDSPDVSLRIRKARDGRVGKWDCQFDGISFRPSPGQDIEANGMQQNY